MIMIVFEIRISKERKEISEGENGNRPILIKDIMVDANRIKARREKRKILGLD